jgi:dTDP-glucose 4,6-dehydratase
MAKTYLITGGAGFIGSNFVHYFLDTHPDDKIVNLDILSYAGNLKNLVEVENNPRYTFAKGDICDSGFVEELFSKYQFDGVYHFAAESHVDNSIKNPEIFLKTNVLGTFTLIHTSYKHWMEKPFQIKKGSEHKRFLHVSTDEVYGTLGETGLFEETTPYAPNSPYSASKASSDFVIRSYHHTYGMNTVTTNCSNNYGPRQHSEKLIPTVIRKALSGESIPVYGDGKNVRDWLYVMDHCSGIDLAFQKGKSGETYNIGGRNERNNNQIVDRICTILDSKKPKTDGNSYKSQIKFVEDRPGHDKRYAIDATKLENELSWRAKENFDTGIEKTIDWYLKNN